MRLFVTGGAGFIGSAFVRYWLREHPADRVAVFDALTYAGNLANLREVETNPQHHFIKGDITDADAVRQALQDSQAEVIVHFAAESHVDRSVKDPAAFVRTNVLGTQVLLDQALNLGIARFHHVSTDEVFGSLPLESTQKFSEATPYDPRSPYSASKAGADFLVRAYAHTYGLPVTISNCSNNYGPYHFPEKLVPLMILNALAGKELPVYGDGKHVRDWIYVEDHVRAIDLILHKGRLGETYCVGGEAERSNLEVVRAVLRLLKRPESLIRFVADRPGHDRRYAIDTAKIKAELGFAPEYSFEQGLAQTVHWYEQNPDWVRSVQSQEYRQYVLEQYGA